MGADIVRLCRFCGHAEAHHGPISGRYTDTGQVVPGRLCFFSENMQFMEPVCPCSGFNTVPCMGFMEVIQQKLRGNHAGSEG